MTVREILVEWLTERGYHGLYAENCGCGLDDLIPCGERCEDCKPGYARTIQGHEIITEQPGGAL